MRRLIGSLLMMMSTVVAAGLVKTGGWRLADSPSPYLQMHADNPVEWYPWGEAAFALRTSRFFCLSVMPLAIGAM
ncbi:MAG: hypothetical protein CO182_04785 [Lysobacterales bacterium CG_4_9_14_3_um_filter_62_6]|nr:MAG: hypothetical protein CO182_04785 [Xanthomonadales bacterium CG_4_9_14_3_um_filter_62_6]